MEQDKHNKTATERQQLRYFIGVVDASNDKRQPREAVAADAGIQAERNGCLRLAARSGSASSLWVFRRLFRHLGMSITEAYNV